MPCLAKLHNIEPVHGAWSLGQAGNDAILEQRGPEMFMWASAAERRYHKDWPMKAEKGPYKDHCPLKRGRDGFRIVLVEKGICIILMRNSQMQRPAFCQARL